MQGLTNGRLSWGMCILLHVEYQQIWRLTSMDMVHQYKPKQNSIIVMEPIQTLCKHKDQNSTPTLGKAYTNHRVKAVLPFLSFPRSGSYFRLQFCILRAELLRAFVLKPLGLAGMIY